MEENRSTFRLSGREKAGLIWHYLRPCWGHFAAALLCACLSMALNALTPQIIRITVDSILGSEEAKLPALLLRVLPLETLRQEPVTALWWAAGAVMVTALLRGLCSFGQRAQLSRGSEAYVKGLRDDLYRRIQYLPFAWHKQHPTGDIIQRCTSDVDVIRTFVCNQLVEVVRTVFLIILYLWIMFRMNVKLSLIALAFIPIVGLSSGVFYRKISSRFKTADEAEGEVTTCAQENLTAVRVVRAFGREKYEEDKFQAKSERYAGLWIHLGKLLSVYWASGTLLTCLQVMVIILAGIHESVAGAMTLGAFVAFVSYNESLAWPVRSLGRVLSDMSKAGVSMDRVGYILRSPEEQDQPDDVPFPGGDIVFDHVTFGYEGQPVLKDVSFTIREGETFAVLGGTGSGKSTLVHLLDRLYDVPEGSGRITIGGVDLRHIRRSDLRRHIGLVLQEPFLFSQTIGENIRAVRPDAPEDAMRRAAAIACARLFIAVGVRRENMIFCDSQGVVTTYRTDINEIKREFATTRRITTLAEAIHDADVFLGVSKADVLTPEMLRTMATNPIVMALANPDPEIAYDKAVVSRPDIIFATGRSDYPNQVNNVLGFPYIFRGALDVRATKINEAMKLAAARALAELAQEPVPSMVLRAYALGKLEFGRGYLIPKPLDPRLLCTVTPAVARAAIESGVARQPITDWDAYIEKLRTMTEI